jgi:cytochrome P450
MFEVSEQVGRTLVDPKAYASWGPLHEVLTELRRTNPIARVSSEGYDPFWAVTKFPDIQEISRKNTAFRQNGFRVGLYSKAAIKRLDEVPPNRAMTLLDGEDHAQLRRITSSWFMPGNVKKREDQLRPLAIRAVEDLIATDGECDFVESVAIGFPLRVILSILGVPPEDEQAVLRITQRYFKSGRTPAGVSVGSDGAPLDNGAIEEFRTYFRSLLSDRRSNPRDDLASVIAGGTVSGSSISDDAALGYYFTVATAGHDTTSASMAGAMWAFCENPDQYELMKTSPNLVAKLPDEAVRWTTPVQVFMRTATEDVVMRDRKIAAGDWLMLSYPSGNRDEEVFSDPFAFRIDRPERSNVGFGYGGHMCLGMYLAKLEISLFYQEMFKRIASVELAGMPERATSYFVGGPNYVPIRYRLA